MFQKSGTICWIPSIFVVVFCQLSQKSQVDWWGSTTYETRPNPDQVDSFIFIQKNLQTTTTTLWIKLLDSRGFIISKEKKNISHIWNLLELSILRRKLPYSVKENIEQTTKEDQLKSIIQGNTFDQLEALAMYLMIVPGELIVPKKTQ